MATVPQVHSWLNLLVGPDVVDNKVSLAMCIYLAQPAIPDVGCILELCFSDVQLTETLGERPSESGISCPGEAGMHLNMNGTSYFIPRLADVYICPVGALSREMMHLTMGSAMGSMDQMMSMMSMPLFSKTGDGKLPVMSIGDFCKRSGKAMSSALGLNKTPSNHEVLQMLSWTRSLMHPGHPSSAAAPVANGVSATVDDAAAAADATAGATQQAVSEKVKVCAVCGGQSKLKCGGCKQVKYCSQTCQKSHWKQHKLQCNKS